MNELTHVGASLLLPPTGAIPLLLLAWWLRQRRQWLARALFVLGLLAVWVGSTEFGAISLQERLLGPQQALSIPALQHLPPRQSAIVVLGAGARKLMPEYASSQLKPLSIDRLRYGIWLSRQTGIPLLFTGGAPPTAKHQGTTEASLAQLTAQQEFGFDIRWLENQARDTRENASYSAALLRDTPVRRVILVTHDVHMRRALRAFREALPPEVEIIAAPIGVPVPGWEWRDFVPSQEGAIRARYLGYEWLGYLADH